MSPMLFKVFFENSQQGTLLHYSSTAQYTRCFHPPIRFWRNVSKGLPITTHHYRDSFYFSQFPLYLLISFFKSWYFSPFSSSFSSTLTSVGTAILLMMILFGSFLSITIRSGCLASIILSHQIFISHSTLISSFSTALSFSFQFYFSKRTFCFLNSTLAIVSVILTVSATNSPFIRFFSELATYNSKMFSSSLMHFST